MDNFFSSAFEYNAFKRALKVTDGETVVINILSSDESLKDPVSTKPRKSMSSKYEPSPFGKFFGSDSSSPVDMNDFSSWKNKNYRRNEESFEEDDEDEKSFFSLSDYMRDKSQDTYNELDQARSEVQKPIVQLDNDDPTLQKFSLDGYMHKLEESILAKDKFTENDDLLEPIKYDDDYMNPSENDYNKSQDENFFGSSAGIESFAFDESVSGTKYRLDSDELDKVRDRLDRLERETRNIREKPNEKLITGNELSETKTQKEESEETDNFDDLFISQDDKIQESDSTKSSRGKKLNEVVINTEQVKPNANSNKRPILISTDEIDAEEPDEKTQQEDSIKKSDILTKEDFRDMTNEFMTKFTEILGNSNANNQEEYVDQDYSQSDLDYETIMDYKNNQEELEMKVNELVESKNRTERETEEKLKRIEEERQKIDEDYKRKIKEMEESYSKKYEEFKQKMYIEKLNSERKNKEAENSIKARKNEINNSNLNYNQIGAILKKELKSNFNISNLEMEKKLLEITSEMEKDKNLKLKEDLSQKPKTKVIRKPVVVVKEKPTIVETPPPAPPVPVAPPPAKKPTKRRNRKKTRRIDSDIIGGIDF